MLQATARTRNAVAHARRPVSGACQAETLQRPSVVVVALARVAAYGLRRMGRDVPSRRI